MKKELLSAAIASLLIAGCGGGSDGGGNINNEDRDGDSVIGSVDTSELSGSYVGITDDLNQVYGKIHSFDITDNGYVEFSYMSTSQNLYIAGGYIEASNDFSVKVPLFKTALFEEYVYVGDAYLETTFGESFLPTVPYQMNYKLSTPIDSEVSGSLVFHVREKTNSDLKIFKGTVETDTSYNYDVSNNQINFISNQGCMFTITPKVNLHTGLLKYNFDAVVESATCDVRENTAVAISVLEIPSISTVFRFNVLAKNEHHTFDGFRQL